MSEQNQTTPKVRPQRRRVTRRPSRLRLPTPPPDPSINQDALELPTTPTPSNPNKDIHFFDYVTLLQQPNASTNPLFAPVIATNNAFDHLDKLYKLMDQMLNLRQQNARLQKRIRDLEHIKNLESLHDELCKASTFEEIPELEDDTSFAESLLDTMLTGNKKEFKPKSWARSRLRQSIMKRPNRYRSASLNEKGQSIDVDDIGTFRRSSVLNEREKPAKVSKWTKVKAAFRWEKASPSVSGAKSQDSGLGVMVPMNYEVARYLRVPSTTDDHLGISPGDSGAAEGSSPGSLSSASSIDDIHRQENPRTADDDVYYAKNAKRNLNQIPYVKMRKKIPTQDKFRLSSCSDDYKLDMSEEELLQDDSKVHTSGEHSKGDEDKLREKHEISMQIVERYKQVVAEDEKISKQKASSKTSSKWIRVKKAFLTSSNLRLHPQTRSRSLGVCQEVQLNKNEEENKKVQDEIQRNYRQLQKRLSLEFKGKIQEWNKSRPINMNDSTGPNARADSSSGDPKSQEFMKKMEEWQRIKSQPNNPRKSIQMIKEQNLAPKFKKKLEEWQKIKNQTAKDDLVPASKPKKKLGEWPKWKSVSSHKPEPNEHQPLSDDFLKKLEEWRKLKEIKEKTPSPKLSRKQTSEQSTSKQSKKGNKEQDDKELQWFEKELGKIEKEKQRLEIERHKFLQREERLAKLRRTIVNNGNKKDILIHTPTGLYKFEGISREFTQKLCEWEKAQGIKPEESTFALLSSSFTPHITVDSYESDNSIKPNGAGLKLLLRSKSAESVAVSNLVDLGSPTTHHPSSLSLNNVDELERQCFAMSPNSSAQDIYSSVDNVQHDEPEAVIVEFEDVVEETAGPLEMFEEKHFPIYQREKALNICEENCFVNPYVQVAQYKSSQYSYFLIDEIMTTIKSICKDEERQWDLKNESRPNEDNDVCDSDYDNLQSPDLVEIERKNALQKQRANKIIDNIISLQEAHSKNVSDVTEDSIMSGTHFHNLLESAQDLFSDLFQLTEQLQNIFQSRSSQGVYQPSFSFSDFSYSDVIETASELSSKISEYKRIVTYYFAASEMTTPHQIPIDVTSQEKQDNELEETKCESNYSLLKSKRIKFKRKDYCEQTLDESNYVDQQIQNDDFTSICPIVLENLIIPTKPNYVSASPEICTVETKFPEVFVKTTKKVFAPIIQIQSEQTDTKPQTEKPKVEISEPSSSVGLPPLPASPMSQRKMSKEISPSIKLMLAKYNQLISEQENISAKSAGSSGSASPVAWRSPVSERRVKAQRERYLEVVRKNFGNEVKKSASVSILNTDKKPTQLESPVENVSQNQPKQTKGILRSTSASTIPLPKDLSLHLKLILPEKIAPNPRTIKIEQAKKEFLNAPDISIAGPSSAPILSKSYSSHTNRSSLVSMGSESSCGSSTYGGLLVKSVSAGMINVDEDTYKKIDPAFHQEGYVTLPRLVQKEKEGFLAGKMLLSNIASKFRKVRMRKHKEHKKMSTVSTLCRQSLVVDINLENQEKENRSDSLTVPVYNRASSSEDTSPSSSRSGSWIRRSRIFKAL